MSDTTTTTVDPPGTTATTTHTSATDSLWAPQSVIALYMLTIGAGTIAGVFFKGTDATINTIVGLVIGSCLGAVSGFYFGSSRGSQVKDERAGPSQVVTTTQQPAVPLTQPNARG